MAKPRKAAPQKAKPQKYYCVIQTGHTLFGIGKTPVGALRDANKWLDRKVTLAELQANDPRVDGSLVLLPCSKAVYEYIQKGGHPGGEWTQDLRRGKVVMSWEI